MIINQDDYIDALAELKQSDDQHRLYLEELRQFQEENQVAEYNEYYCDDWIDHRAHDIEEEENIFLASRCSTYQANIRDMARVRGADLAAILHLNEHHDFNLKWSAK